MATDLRVVKHNQLIEASYHLTLEEQRLILSCIAKIDPRENVDFPDEITITAKEYAKNFGINLSDSYRCLKRAGDNLFNQTIKLSNDVGNGKLRWIYRIHYFDGEARISVKFSPDVKPYLGQLSGMFSSYKLRNVGRITSTHAIRLYELLNQWRSSGKRYIHIDEFKDMLVLGDKYPKYADLRRWVIEPGINEVNKKSDLNVSFSVEKKGRKVHTLKFDFSSKKQVITEV